MESGKDDDFVTATVAGGGTEERERLEEKFHGEFGTLKRFSCERRPAKTKFKGQSWMAMAEGLREEDNRIKASFF